MNEIKVRNKSLGEAEAVTAHLLRLGGDSFTDIVHKLGTNANRIGEVMRGERWPDAAEKARALHGGDLFGPS